MILAIGTDWEIVMQTFATAGYVKSLQRRISRDSTGLESRRP